MQSPANIPYKNHRFAFIGKRAAALLALPLVMGMLAGCWNYREVDNLLVVAGFALDQGYEGHRYHLTIDVADTTKAGKDKPVESAPLESEGDTVIDAVDNCIRKAGLELYWPNCQLAVVSQAVAQEGIGPLVDWLSRDQGIRLTTELFVSQEPTAKEVLLAKSATMQITSFEIDKSYELNEQVQPVAPYWILTDIINTLGEHVGSLTLPALRMSENGGKKVPALAGVAAFDKDRLVAYLSADDSKYAMYAMNHIKGGTLDVKGDMGNTVGALIVYENRTKMKPTYENGKLTLCVETRTAVSVDELDTKMDMLSKDHIGQFEFMAESQLAEHIARTIQIVQQQCGVDIFGFGDALHKSDPEAWAALEADWNTAFQGAAVRVSSKIDIRNPEQSRKSVGGGG